jgi:heptosyltransferase-2
VKILLAKRRAMGDTVFLSSTVENLSAALPGSEIHVLAPGAFLPLLEGHPKIKTLLSYDEGWVSLLKKIRALALDQYIQLHSSSGRRWMAYLSGAKAVNFSVQNNETEVAYGKHPNALEWDGFFLRSMFGEKISVPGPAPKIYLSQSEKEKGREFWKNRGIDGRRVVFLGLGASRSTKRWPAAHFARFAELLRDRTDLVPAIIVGPGSTEATFGGEVLDQFRAKALRAYVGADKGDFIHADGLSTRDLACALSAVRAYVGNDSGPKHVAAALGIPTFTFFGPEDPVEWHPYARETHPVFFTPGLNCRREDEGRWCGLEVCNEQKHRCMVDLDPVDAFAEVKKTLGL